jgi:hypothetical protein
MSYLKRTLLITVFFASLLSSCFGGSPKLTLEEASVDLGEVINGDIRTLEISVRNDGTSDLVIESVTTSCGCTSAEVTPTTIPVGESGKLSINFDSGAHGPESNRPVIRQVFIATNDRNDPETEFQFSAVVVANDS